MQDSQPGKEPKVLIAGAGIAGLTLAILLDKARIEYEIFERNEQIRSVGSAACLGFNVMPLMDQLGLLEELRSISKRVDGTTIFKEDMEVIREIRLRNNKELNGYETLVTSRDQFHALLLSRVPKEKIRTNKKIVSLTQDNESVTITCADGSSYTGDILVGADGAYSSVRTALYTEIKKEGDMPKVDEEELISHYLSIMGTTDPLNPDNYEGLNDVESHCDTIIGEERGLTWRYFTIPNNRICWRIDLQSSSVDPSLYDGWLNADYNNYDIDQLPERWKDYKLAIMGDLKGLFENTPKDTITKVVLEEKIYETWKHGRTVLIGDGALNSILDAIILANAIYEMPSAEQKHVTKALDDFYLERFPTSKREMNPSQQLSTIMAGKVTWLDTAGRFLLLKLVPKYFKEKSLEYNLSYRPQATFLPRIESKGSVPMTPQRPSKKYAAYLKAQAATGTNATV
ncbi:hypothetical protein BGZ80_009900 [Entomortierella chlamydospora]|uniref:FAD-binding domain-containing protein n=1 Tax=Entomortierella chlamydospora TaxID=101097 RepID=A0A9P6MVN8_9FUNG|nr:hypothetical protein BGZ80_009900 [Entomortierella chlamydospora]